MPSPPPTADRPAPARLPAARRTAIVGTAVALNTALYLAINARAVDAPHLMQRSGLDAALGWHAWTIWPYWLLLLLAPWLALGIRGREAFTATFRAYAIALGLNATLWLAWPTRLPRAPLPTGLDPLTDAAWRVLHALDGPANCFPSGHVTLPLVVAAGWSLEHRRGAPALWLLLVALVPTIVTTGQHVLLDAAGGAATAVLGLALARHPALGALSRWRPRRPRGRPPTSIGRAGP
ncbi:phosphatase PAP2 family protein [Lysobacter xanthus]